MDPKQSEGGRSRSTNAPPVVRDPRAARQPGGSFARRAAKALVTAALLCKRRRSRSRTGLSAGRVKMRNFSVVRRGVLFCVPALLIASQAAAQSNTGYGVNSLQSITTGNSNSAFGVYALTYTTDGS